MTPQIIELYLLATFALTGVMCLMAILFVVFELVYFLKRRRRFRTLTKAKQGSFDADD